MTNLYREPEPFGSYDREQASTDGLSLPYNVLMKDTPKPSKSNKLKPRELYASGDIGIMTLRDGRCRWPTGSGPGGEQMYCGASCDPATVYCEAHTSKAAGAKIARR